MFSDPQFWIFCAFIIFIATVFKPIRKILITSLDYKINEIKNNKGTEYPKLWIAKHF